MKTFQELTDIQKIKVLLHSQHLTGIRYMNYLPERNVARCRAVAKMNTFILNEYRFRWTPQAK